MTMCTPKLLTLGFIVTFLATSSSGGLARDTGLIFVSSEQAASVLVIDPETNGVVKHLKTSRGPHDMHFNADHSKLYVACADDDAIDIIDVAKLEVTGRLLAASGAKAFGIDDRLHRIYMPNRQGSSLSVIDTDQNLIIHEVPTAAEPEEVLASEDGHFVYVAAEIGDLIHLVDAGGGYVVQSVAVGTGPRRLAATPDGKELWVSTGLSREVDIIDREKFIVVGRIEFLPPGARKVDVTPADLVITRDGKTAYVALDHAGQVAAVDIQARAVRAYIPVGSRASGLAMASDERKLYVADRYGDAISIVDLRSNRVIASMPVSRRPSGLAVDD
jgi:YVTN family beta-propeller protein